MQTVSEDLGGGFLDHGVATPMSNHRGTVATVDGDQRNVVLVWLFDHRGGYALLLIDAETGKSEEFETPFPVAGDCPFACILSSQNKLYTHFDSHFVEFDPRLRKYTFVHETTPQMAMSMTEDDNGVIWSATYPGSGVVSYNPTSGDFKDYGHLYNQNWQQYPRSICADDTGWIYFAIGNTAQQIMAMDPLSGKATPIIPDEERSLGMASVHRDVNGKVYGVSHADSGDIWRELYQGTAAILDGQWNGEEKQIITGSQSLFHHVFPDGKILEKCDLIERTMVITDPALDKSKEVAFDYSSDGAHIMGVATAPNETICGGTAFPMRFFSYDPVTETFMNEDAYCQSNTVTMQGDRFFVGGYTAGYLIEWDPSSPWVDTKKDNPKSNPLFLTDCKPSINRPHALLAHPDGKTIIMAGTPDYGYTGGGLLFWDRQTGERILIEHTEILPEHSTMSLAALPDGTILGGSTTDPGTGGERKAEQSELYIMNVDSKEVEWHEAILDSVHGYTNLCVSRNGLVYGMADTVRFFVFDPQKRQIIHEWNTEAGFGGISYQQGHRKFVKTGDGQVFLLLTSGIVSIDDDTFQLTMLAESPVPIQFGGDILNGRIYFGSSSHLYSYTLPN